MYKILSIWKWDDEERCSQLRQREGAREPRLFSQFLSGECVWKNLCFWHNGPSNLSDEGISSSLKGDAEERRRLKSERLSAFVTNYEKGTRAHQRIKSVRMRRSNSEINHTFFKKLKKHTCYTNLRVVRVQISRRVYVTGIS